MCVKLIPTNGKHILKPLVGYITVLSDKRKLESCWCVMLADLNHWQTTPLRSFQGPTTWCANKIPFKKQLHMKELKPLNKFRRKIGGILLTHCDNQSQRSNFPCLLRFRSSKILCANIRKQLNWWQLVETVYISNKKKMVAAVGSHRCHQIVHTDRTSPSPLTLPVIFMRHTSTK